MIMRYANFTYFLCLFILIGILVGLYFLLRNKTTRTQKIVILCLIIFNLLQHIFKKYFGIILSILVLVCKIVLVICVLF